MSNKLQTDSETGRLKIKILGGFSLETSTGNMVTVSSRKACGVIAYLAINMGKPIAREFLTGMFWSDRGEKQARASLRQTLKQIRTLFADIGFEGFSAKHQVVFLEDQSVEVDVSRVHGKIVQSTFDEILKEENGVPEKILYGFENLDPSFTAWLHVIRKKWGDYFVEALHAILITGSMASAKHAADALINIDPTYEEAQRYIIRHHADAGNISAAIRQYNILWEVLGDEYDMEPEESTIALIADIKSGNYPSNQPEIDKPALSMKLPLQHAQTAQEKIGPPVIGIAQFIQGGEWGLEDYLINGFRRELVASLTRFREWITLDNPPSYDNGHSFGSEQNRYELEGSYQSDNGVAQIVITLKRSSTKQLIWSENIKLILNNWFVTQQTIVRRIAVALNVHLSAERIDQFAGAPDLHLDIYDRWLRGQDLFFGFTPDKWNRAAMLFDSVVDAETNFAPVYSSLAQIQNAGHLLFPGKLSQVNNHTEALELGKMAVKVDPLDTRGHLSMGWSYAMLRKFDNSEISYGLATELNENDPWTMVSSALGWAFLDFKEQAGDMADEALKLSITPSPMYWSFQATIRFMCNDYEGCVHASENSNYAINNVAGWNAAALHHLGLDTEAKQAAETFRNLVSPKWVGKKPPDDEQIGTWFLSSFPIKNPSTWQALCDGLIGAGIKTTKRLEAPV